MQEDKQSLKPKGIGLTVAIDWALAAQVISQALLPFVGVTGPHHALPPLPLIIGAPIAAGLLFYWGDSLRSGRRLAWYAQIAFMSIIFLVGLFGLPGTFASIRHGDWWPAYPAAIIMLLFPFALSRLLQPVTRQWFATTSAEEANARHSSLGWYVPTVLCAMIGGFFVGLADTIG